MEKISAMTDAHTSWLGALEFYKQELDIIKGRLTEIAGKNTGREAAAEIEHFENQVKVQNEHIDILSHDIRENLVKAAKEYKANGGDYIDNVLIQVHDRQKEKFDTEEQIIRDLRKNFDTFASEWL